MGLIASGALTWEYHASGMARSGHIGDAAVVSGSIASGSVAGNHIASGTISAIQLGSGTVVRAAQFMAPFHSGTSWSLNVEEPVSGVRAVAISQSGKLRIAMASVSGRMPAVGVVFDNVASGIPANVYTHGMFQFSSGMADFSGWLGNLVWVGRSGQLVTRSGSWNSGGLNVASGGDWFQRVGYVVNSGAIVANIHPEMNRNQLVGPTIYGDAGNWEEGY